MNEVVEKVARAVYLKFENRPAYAQLQMNEILAEELARAAILQTVKQAMAWRITKRMAGPEPTCDELLRHLCDAALKEG